MSKLWQVVLWGENKMTYKLALQLKNAGFPSEYKNWECKECGKPYEDSEVGTSCVLCGWNGATNVDIVFRAPTLSELIEACGARFGDLEKGMENTWLAKGGKYIYEDGSIGNYEFEVFGSTPEEAVARLWLALNKK